MVPSLVCSVKTVAMVCLSVIALLVCWRVYPVISAIESSANGSNPNGPELLSLIPVALDFAAHSIQNDIDQKSVQSILKPLEYPLTTYIRALKGSIRVLQVPKGKLLNQAVEDCKKHRQAPLIDHQHSLELRFPYALRQMQLIAEKHNRPEFGLLHHNSTNQEPLFYYLQSLQYYIVYCTYSRHNKESWVVGERYVTKLATHTINTKEFKRNTGTDMMVPASHPKSGPYGVKYAEKATYQRQAFLRTDMDWNGYTPKDIVVPYYVPTTPGRLTSLTGIKESSTVNKQTSLLLFFAGGRNPPGGLREQLESALSTVTAADQTTDIVFTTSAITKEKFYEGLHQSVFCASVRGDTASSSRLFAIIEAGCIPVIISDWLLLPFESIIDYTTFSVRFPESIVHNPRQLVAHLRSISPTQIGAMQQALKSVRAMVIYPEMSSVSEFHLLNPVTLTLVEMFMRRKEYCDGLQYANHKGTQGTTDIKTTGTENSSDMCVKLNARLKDAMQQK